MQALPVRVPSGSTYWTVLDDELRVVVEADAFLRELRFGRSRAVETTKSYAGGIVLYLRWGRDTRREWHTAACDLGLFILWLKWNPGGDEPARGVVPGPGSKQVRGESRINKVLAAVRGFLVHAVISKKAPAWVMELLYELGDERDLPAQARGESEGMRYRLRARHRLQEPEPASASSASSGMSSARTANASGRPTCRRRCCVSSAATCRCWRPCARRLRDS